MLNGIKVRGVGWPIKERHTGIFDPCKCNLGDVRLGIILLANDWLLVLVTLLLRELNTLPEVVKDRENVIAI
jgi:hypothetical protein